MLRLDLSDGAKLPDIRKLGLPANWRETVARRALARDRTGAGG